MKKIISKSKKVVAVFLLAIMVVCAVAPSVQAYSFSKSGSRGNNGGYYSVTTVTAYTDAGYVAKGTAGAQISNTKWKYVSRTGTAKAESAKTTVAGDAYHANGVDGNIYGVWIEN